MDLKAMLFVMAFSLLLTSKASVAAAIVVPPPAPLAPVGKGSPSTTVPGTPPVPVVKNTPPPAPSKAPPPSPAVSIPIAPPPPVLSRPRNTKECFPLCTVRCTLHSRKNVCLRACVTCCDRCKCVPPGYYGQKEKCGKCYANMTTRGGRSKCP